jgi:hypothetical protein
MINHPSMVLSSNPITKPHVAQINPSDTFSMISRR